MSDIPIKPLKYNVPGGGGQQVYPQTSSDAVTAPNGSTLTEILSWKLWSLDEVNQLPITVFESGNIAPETAVAIGISDATDFMQVIKLPLDIPYPSQILICEAGKMRMYYRCCINGIWQTPKLLMTQDDFSTSLVTFNDASFAHPITGSDDSYVYKIGKIAFLKITVKFQSTLSGGTTWITLPEGYRPFRYVKAPSVATLADGQVIPSTISIWPDGIVASDGGAIADRWCFVYVSYPVP